MRQFGMGSAFCTRSRDFLRALGLWRGTIRMGPAFGCLGDPIVGAAELKLRVCATKWPAADKSMEG
jgi:hypothetical protein